MPQKARGIEQGTQTILICCCGRRRAAPKKQLHKLMEESLRQSLSKKFKMLTVDAARNGLVVGEIARQSAFTEGVGVELVCPELKCSLKDAAMHGDECSAGFGQHISS